MERHEAIEWLNYRLQLDDTLQRNNHFTLTDLNFFMYFIKEQTGKDVHINKLINSIKYHSESCMDWVEKLINYLILKYDILIVTEIIPNEAMNLFLKIPTDSLKILKYK